MNDQKALPLDGDNKKKESKGNLILNEKNIGQISLDDLRFTSKEHNYDGEPLIGVHHFDLFDKVINSISQNGLSYEVEPVFVAQNKDKNQPGITRIKQLKEVYGDDAIEAAIVRRVLGRVNIKDDEDDETNMAVAINYHQGGYQVAMGTNVKVCSNMSILSADNMMSSYGNNKMPDLQKVMEVLNEWMGDFQTKRANEKRIIQLMKDTRCSYNDVRRIIGHMTMLRVSKDNTDLRKDMANVESILNQGQISKFTEDYLLEYRLRGGNAAEQREEYMSLWDVYNVGTNLTKAGVVDIPNVLNQNRNMGDFLKSEYGIE